MSSIAPYHRLLLQDLKVNHRVIQSHTAHVHVHVHQRSNHNFIHFKWMETQTYMLQSRKESLASPWRPFNTVKTHVVTTFASKVVLNRNIDRKEIKV